MAPGAQLTDAPGIPLAASSSSAGGCEAVSPHLTPILYHPCAMVRQIGIVSVCGEEFQTLFVGCAAQSSVQHRLNHGPFSCS